VIRGDDGRGSLVTLLEDLAMGARFLSRLPGFLRHPVTLEEAQATLRRRLAHRAADFLKLARSTMFGYPESPYGRLLAHAGCQYGDLERLVRAEGLEGALRALYRAGVYLTVDEMKGRQPVVRGNTAFTLDPGRLRNPTATPHFITQSSGTRGPRTPIAVDLASIRDQAVDLRLSLEASGITRFAHAVWGVPGGAALGQLLRFAAGGCPPARWFSQVDPRAASLHPRYRWSARALRWGSLLVGAPLPAPRYAPPGNPRPIAAWMAEESRRGRPAHVWTFPSSAMTVCRYARDAGIDLAGAWFNVGGEPVTEARLAAVREVGARMMPGYGSSESGLLGYGCARPSGPDDVHVLSDLHAVIQPGPGALPPGLRSGSLLLSSLRTTARLVLLNVSLGDQAVLEDRACGCPLEPLGWTTHLRDVRSYEKLTAAGMTFLDADALRVLEEVLPGRFGGGSGDYQLLEDEAEDGRPRLRLLVSPAVGPVDRDAVAEAFLTAMGPGSELERVMGLAWREAVYLRVEQRPLERTPAGKVLHLLGGERQRSAGS
jgi:hypothetical protein